MRIDYNGKSIEISSRKERVSLVIVGYKNEVYCKVLSFGVSSSKTYLAETIQPESPIRVQLISTEWSSEPTQVVEKNRDELLNEYNSLKEILLQKGLL